MLLTDYLERNARLWGIETALVEINPSEERDQAVTWREFNLIENANPDAPYRREISWREFDRRANRFANLLLSRGIARGTKVAILMMNCLEWLPIYFGILKAGCIAVPMNFRYSSEEIKYCLELADVEVLVFGPEFISRMDAIHTELTGLRFTFFIGKNGPDYTEDCLRLMVFCSSTPPPVALDEKDYAAIYFSSGTTGFPKAILHNHRALAYVYKFRDKYGKQYTAFVPSDNFFNTIISITDKKDNSVSGPVTKKLKDRDIDGLFLGWLWYIFLMAISTIFKDAIGLWILISVVFFRWRSKKIKEEGTYTEW